MSVVEVDGSYGEGGGQILRTAVAFSIIQNRPVRVRKIRAGREVPGLRQQHTSTLQVLSRIFGGSLEGAQVGSSEVAFIPGKADISSTRVDMRTAASITLLLQAAIPAIALARSRVSLEILGGTDVPWSPTFDYLSEVVRPAYELLGIRFWAVADRRGYYPKGGGRVRVEVEPAPVINTLNMPSARTPATVNLVSRCANLPQHVAERQLKSLERVLSSSGVEVASRVLTVEQADSPGSSVLAYLAGKDRILGADAIGARGRPAEEVGKQAAEGIIATISSGAAVDPNLADMVAPLLSVANGQSTICIPQVSLHLKTGLHVAKVFTGCDYSWTTEGGSCLLTVKPVAGHNA